MNSHVEVASDEEEEERSPPSSSVMDLIRNQLSATCVAVYGGPKSVIMQSQGLKYPVGVMELPDHSVLVCDTFNHRLVRFEEDGKYYHIIKGTPPMCNPSAAVLIPEIIRAPGDHVPAEPFFAVKDKFNIHVYNSNYDQIDIIQRLKHPYGLTMDDKGILVTVETGGNLPVITKINLVTKMLTRVPFNLVPNEQKRLSSKPRFIAYHQDDVLVVVDLGLDLVAMVAMEDGSVLRTFGSPGSGPGQFRDPSGVVCDEDGFIIIGDSRNHRVQIFSETGEFMCVLPVDRPLRRPSGLFLTPCGHLIVINYWENNVVKYKLSVAVQGC
ncbi:tripartite motif-containing protein 2 [Hyalella azteca]|uniref:Tripartite motif-containing protein 2 n=1 Tax=Hyalella azteca TaxID=294128 RepID=A0A8B7PN86_HYAAZ|nr:tripartite motif-containing protein 2 [Hyalella azteca]